MYWNVPKDHRKIQQVILTAWTTTQWGVMLSSPVLSWELSILSTVCSANTPLQYEANFHLLFFPWTIRFLAVLTIAWWSPILSYIGHFSAQTGGFCCSAGNPNLCLFILCFLNVWLSPETLFSLNKPSVNSHFTDIHIHNINMIALIPPTVGLRAWLCASVEVRWVELIQLSGLGCSG